MSGSEKRRLLDAIPRMKAAPSAVDMMGVLKPYFEATAPGHLAAPKSPRPCRGDFSRCPGEGARCGTFPLCADIAARKAKESLPASFGEPVKEAI